MIRFFSKFITVFQKIQKWLKSKNIEHLSYIVKKYLFFLYKKPKNPPK